MKEFAPRRKSKYLNIEAVRTVDQRFDKLARHEKVAVTNLVGKFLQFRKHTLTHDQLSDILMFTPAKVRSVALDYEEKMYWDDNLGRYNHPRFVSIRQEFEYY